MRHPKVAWETVGVVRCRELRGRVWDQIIIDGSQVSGAELFPLCVSNVPCIKFIAGSALSRLSFFSRLKVVIDARPKT